MTTANCFTCGVVIAEYDGTEPPRPYVIVAPGETPPDGNYIVHVCPEQPPYVPPVSRPRTVLDWTDELERAAVGAVLPEWELADDDVIFCMSWYDPGYRIDAAPSAPFTVQVRRNGTDLAFAEKGVHFDEVSMAAQQAAEVAASIGVDPWAQLAKDLAEEQAAAEREPEQREQEAKAAVDTAVVYEQAAAEAVRDAEHAAAHAEEHPDDEQLQQVAAYIASQVQVMRDYADQAAAKAANLALSAGS